MKIACIAAMDQNRLIGSGLSMPWRIEGELIRFRRLSLGGTVCMGRKTYLSIGRALPGRRTIVLSRSKEFHPSDCEKAETIEELLSMVDDSILYVAGGAQIYRTLLPASDIIYLTEIDDIYQGDSYFPPIPSAFKEVYRQEISGDPSYSYVSLVRGEP